MESKIKILQKKTDIRLTQYHLAIPGRFKWHLVKFCTVNKSSWKMQFSNRLTSLKHVWNCVQRKSLELQGSCILTFYILCLSRAKRKKLIFRPNCLKPPLHRTSRMFIHEQLYLWRMFIHKQLYLWNLTRRSRRKGTRWSKATYLKVHR